MTQKKTQCAGPYKIQLQARKERWSNSGVHTSKILVLFSQKEIQQEEHNIPVLNLKTG